MEKKPLKIVSAENSSSFDRSSQPNRRTEAEARFDRMWLQNPQKLDPQRSEMQKERVARTIRFIQEQIDPSGCLAADLGCGNGYLTRKLRDLGAHVHAVDVSGNALKEAKKYDCTNIELKQEYIPKSTLADDYYDLVIASDLIAYLDPKEYRLFFSELARIIKPEGIMVCSTPIDVYSEGALQKFFEYILTEFEADDYFLSYHFLLIRFLDFFKAPGRFARASRNPNYRKQCLEDRVSFNRWWFKINSTKILGYFWTVVRYAANPIVHFFENSPRAIHLLEKISKSIWNESAISHVIVSGKRKSILPPAVESMQSREQKHKKQLWE